MSLENDILIDKYLRGLLDENEVADFKLKLKSDVEFRKNFVIEEALWLSQNDNDWSFSTQKNEEIKAYKKLLDDDDLQNLKKTLSQVNSELKDTSTKKKNFNFYYLAAASIVILISLSLFMKQDVSNQDLVNEFLNTTDLPSFVSRGDISTDDLIKAQQFFESKDYQKSLDIFVPALEASDVNASVYLYTGLGQMKLENYTAAESTFDKLISSDLLDAQKGYWYKALLYLEQDKRDAAKTVLKSIVSKSLYNHIKAKELLNELNND